MSYSARIRRVPELEHDPERSKPVVRKSHAPLECLCEQNRGKTLAAFDGGLVGRPPGVEKLDELLAGTVVIPLAVPLDDADQMIERLLPAAFAVEREREVKAGLVIE